MQRNGPGKFWDKRGKRVPAPAMALRELAYEGRTGSRRRFRLEGFKGPVFCEVRGRLSDASFLRPIVTGLAFHSLRRKYEWKSAWMYGGVRLEVRGAAADTWGTFMAPVDQPVRIRRVHRLRNAENVPLPMGSGGMMDPVMYRAPSPLLLVLDMPKRAKLMAGSGGGTKVDMASIMDPRNYSGKYLVVGDEWDLQRRFSLSNPFRTLLGLTPRFRRAILAGHPVPGMTPDMVAWAYGWPPLRKPLAQMRRMSVWEYPGAAPFSSSVVFRNGRVLRFEPPGNLP